MARKPRVDLPGAPQHVVQRGNDRRACFFSPDDYGSYLVALREATLKYGVDVHAYCLMTNHVHLLMTPLERGAISATMQSLGRQYVRLINGRYRRTGTLWEGRFKACVVDSGEYLLSCYRYIELNPVRARVVLDPGDYRWSSYRCNAEGQFDPAVAPHAEYLRLAAEEGARQQAYRALFAEELELTELREALTQELPLAPSASKTRSRR
jgi:putative transposase